MDAAGATPDKRVISYCHIGQQATVVYFAARLLGRDARLYDGSVGCHGASHPIAPARRACTLRAGSGARRIHERPVYPFDWLMATGKRRAVPAG